MTSPDRSTPPTDARELDARVAKEVLGWALAPDTNPPTRFWPIKSTRVWRDPGTSNVPHALPAFSSDWSAIRLVEDEIAKRGLGEQYADELSEALDLCWCRGCEGASRFTLLRASCAIRCRAALAVAALAVLPSSDNERGTE